MTNYIITLLTKACNRVNLVRAASAAGFNVSGNPKHPAKYVCPLCKAEQTSRAGENANPAALKVAYTTAHLFVHPDGRKMLACCAGHRRLFIADNHPTFEKAKAAAVKVEVADNKPAPQPPQTPLCQPTPPQPENKHGQCNGRTKAGERCKVGALENGYCRFHQNQVPVPSNTSAAPGF